jgi:transcriptional regulator with XRE-family HTH domain
LFLPFCGYAIIIKDFATYVKPLFENLLTMPLFFDILLLEVVKLNERVKLARKALNLNQTEFGGRLGVTPAAISKIESGERALTEQMILAICREYGINETWLRTGSGEMFVENDGTILASLVAEHGLAEWEHRLIETYLKIPDGTRAAVADVLVALAHAIQGGGVESVDGFIAVPAQPDPRPPQTLPRSAAVPYADNIEASRELTEEEAVALVRARFEAKKKVNASSMTSEKPA